MSISTISTAISVFSLKALSTGEDLKDYLDTDEIISYFTVHNFVLNYDSYTGNMLHNYYLYENDGEHAMLPWDYNLSFGAFSGGEKDGELSTISDEQDSGNQVDASSISIKAMGKQNQDKF